MPGVERLEEELRQRVGDLANAKADRDRLICELFQAGVSMRKIGRLADLSHVAVRKILQREKLLPR